MAKKKPTYRNVKQGQTIYVIDRHFERFDGEPEVQQYFIYSQKEPLPPEGCIVERLPVSLLRLSLLRRGNGDFYFSRRKAIAAL